jgi:hypothetical protein
MQEGSMYNSNLSTWEKISLGSMDKLDSLKSTTEMSIKRLFLKTWYVLIMNVWLRFFWSMAELVRTEKIITVTKKSKIQYGTANIP